MGDGMSYSFKDVLDACNIVDVGGRYRLIFIISILNLQRVAIICTQS